MSTGNRKTGAGAKLAEGRLSTERLQFAIFLHASQKLEFIGIEPSSFGRIQFVFSDPEGQGAQYELEFDRGAAVPATAIFASQKFLRREMSQILNIGKSNQNERNSYTQRRRG